MTSRTAVVLGSGIVGGSVLTSNRDSLFGDLTSTLGFKSSQPLSLGAPSTEIVQLRGMMQSLTTQVEHLANTQRHSHAVIVSSSQPTTVLGVPLWKVVGLAGVTGAIYMKVYGYEMRDLVYVSKKHFDSATAVLKQQYEQLEQAVELVKVDLLQRIGLVETKVTDARDSINAKIDLEVGKIDRNMTDLSAGLEQVDQKMNSTALRIDNIALDVTDVKNAIGNFSSELDTRFAPVYKEVGLFKEETSRSHEALSSEINNIHSKVDDLTRTTQSLFFGLEKQSKGIGLLCDFVYQSQSNPNAAPSLIEDLQEYAKSTSNQGITRTQSASRLKKKSAEGLAGVRAAALPITAN